MNRVDFLLRIAGAAPGDRIFRGLFRLGVLRGPAGSMALFRRWRCVSRFPAAERKLLASKRSGQGGLRSWFVFQM
jgi:hypothetical protein